MAIHRDRYGTASGDPAPGAAAREAAGAGTAAGTGGGAGDGVVLGIDLGGTKIALGLVDRRGKVLADVTLPTEATAGPAAAMDRLAAAARQLAARADRKPLAAGVGAPGPLLLPEGRFTGTPNLPGWNGFALRDELARRLGIPVAVNNDANAAALAEARLGAGRGAAVMVYVTVGTGIGGGLVVGGKLFSGVNGNGVEIGHTTLDPDGPPCGCGNRGCWEALASGPALARLAGERLGPSPRRPGGQWTAKDLLEAAAAGDPAARAVADEYARRLGVGLANAVNAFNPDRLVLGGGVMARYDLLAPAMEAEMRRRALPANAAAVALAPATLGKRAGLVGAALLAWDLLDEPGPGR
ncbi:ROK family protein [Thermaerobacter marianensis DSM 12885]|uniref:ROK family protein n=1 Tax=Thermaerobacter marianensis (strain ATCC 700841 / DSM 12885 / JCM 10246 / 7p75a) TaxID=644966 RepID=E6SGZ7_THEM7|nr:ROK family protein [Thermaerobacter marianensis]ADU50628.1 ROK family protein [Thermaerobacter marianensis DSM 12885]